MLSMLLKDSRIQTKNRRFKCSISHVKLFLTLPFNTLHILNIKTNITNALAIKKKKKLSNYCLIHILPYEYALSKGI